MLIYFMKSWDEGQAQGPQVKILEGPFEGTCWPALEVLPYNAETAAACIKRGDYVMAPGGRIFGPAGEQDDS